MSKSYQNSNERIKEKRVAYILELYANQRERCRQNRENLRVSYFERVFAKIRQVG